MLVLDQLLCDPRLHAGVRDVEPWDPGRLLIVHMQEALEPLLQLLLKLLQDMLLSTVCGPKKTGIKFEQKTFKNVLSRFMRATNKPSKMS